MKTTITPASRLRRSGLSRAIIGATAVGSTGATLMTANAEIVYSGPRNLSTSTLIISGPGGDYEPVNLDGFGTNEFSLFSFFSSKSGVDNHWIVAKSPDFGTIGNTILFEEDIFLKLGAGDTIGAGNTFDGTDFVFIGQSGSSTPLPNSQWTGGSDGYFGYRFNPSGGQDFYGWGHMNFSADAKVMTLVDWAYENTGAPIHAGQIPEPTTSLLLLASLCIAAWWRRR